MLNVTPLIKHKLACMHAACMQHACNMHACMHPCMHAFMHCMQTFVAFSQNRNFLVRRTVYCARNCAHHGGNQTSVMASHEITLSWGANQKFEHLVAKFSNFQHLVAKFSIFQQNSAFFRKTPRFPYKMHQNSIMFNICP